MRGRFRGSSRARSRGGRRSTTSKIIQALSPLQYLTQQSARRIVGETVTSADGIRVRYFTDNALSANTNDDVFAGSRNPQFLIDMCKYGTSNGLVFPRGDTYSGSGGYAINLVNGGQLRVMQTSFRKSHRIINQCNFTIKLTAYLLSNRFHFGATGSNENLYPMEQYGIGLAQLGLDTANPNRANTYISRASYNPLMCPAFKTRYRCHSVKTKNLQPADFADFLISDTRPFVFNPLNYMNTTSQTDVYDSAASMYTHLKGEKFYLFRVEPAQTGENTSAETITSLAPLVHILSKYSYAFKCYHTVRGQISNDYATAGYSNVTSTVDLINSETNQIQTEVEL